MRLEAKGKIVWGVWSGIFTVAVYIPNSLSLQRPILNVYCIHGNKEAEYNATLRPLESNVDLKLRLHSNIACLDKLQSSRFNRNLQYVVSGWGTSRTWLQLSNCKWFPSISTPVRLSCWRDDVDISVRVIKGVDVSSISTRNFHLHLSHVTNLGSSGPFDLLLNALVMTPSSMPYCDLKLEEIGMSLFSFGVFRVSNGDDTDPRWFLLSPEWDALQLNKYLQR